MTLFVTTYSLDAVFPGYLQQKYSKITLKWAIWHVIIKFTSFTCKMYLFVAILLIYKMSLSTASMLTRPYVDVNWRQLSTKEASH